MNHPRFDESKSVHEIKIQSKPLKMSPLKFMIDFKIETKSAFITRI